MYEHLVLGGPVPEEPFSQHHDGPKPPIGYGQQQAQQPQAAVEQGAPQPMPQPASQPPVQPVVAARKPHGWIVAIVAVVAVLIAVLFGISSCTSAVSSMGGSSSNSDAALSPNTVAVIDIDDTIQYDGTTNSPDGLKQQLDRAAKDSKIIAVVLRVNSGGGVATAGEEMATYVKKFREDTGKPVVVSSASTNASAAYEISSQASYIYVARTTAIGAIGTAMQLVDYSGLMSMLGISTDNITSAQSKDSTYGTRELTDEERAYYQAQVDQINETFIQNVAEGRDMSTDEVRALATGMTFTGVDAVQNGLADEIGTKEDAVKYAAQLAGHASDYATASLGQKGSDDLSTLLDLVSENKSISADQLASALKELESNGSVAK